MVRRFINLGSGSSPATSSEPQGLAELVVEGVGTFPLKSLTTIGRASDCDLALSQASVSRHHARIFIEGGHFWIKDLDSGNGTSVNGKVTKLQMLDDGDRLTLGEVQATFRTSARPSGPARLAQDPLEGSDPAIPDGTPTGGLVGSFPDIQTKREPGVDQDLQPTADMAERSTGGEADMLADLFRRIDALRSENETLREEIARMRAISPRSAPLPAPMPNSSDAESARMGKLVAQLERALADANIRIRNLQERLDKGR